jgi:hypothetical protein
MVISQINVIVLNVLYESCKDFAFYWHGALCLVEEILHIVFGPIHVTGLRFVVIRGFYSMFDCVCYQWRTGRH